MWNIIQEPADMGIVCDWLKETDEVGNKKIIENLEYLIREKKWPAYPNSSNVYWANGNPYPEMSTYEGYTGQDSLTTKPPSFFNSEDYYGEFTVYFITIADAIKYYCEF